MSATSLSDEFLTDLFRVIRKHRSEVLKVMGMGKLELAQLVLRAQRELLSPEQKAIREILTGEGTEEE